VFDVLIRGGEVYDGLGGPPRRADVALQGDRIEAVEALSAAPARIQIDARGLAVAPGFIDTHTHSDLACFLGDRHRDLAAADARQGVTTEIAGNCGFSPFPTVRERRGDLGRLLDLLFGPVPVGWSDLSGYRQQVQRAGLCANLAPLVGHGSLRAAVMGFANRPPTPEELGTMSRLVREAFEQGAFGLSSGLVYAPGVYAATDELVELCRAVRRHARPYTSHIRGEGAMVAESVGEALRIGREAGVPVQISHHKVTGKANWGRTEETLGLIDQAVRRGADVMLDVYPYTAGSTMLAAILPPWVHEDGVEAMLARLRDPAARLRLKRELEGGLAGWENKQQAAGWEGILIAQCTCRPETEGKPILELARATGKEPADYVFDLLLEADGRVLAILHMMAEADVQRVLAYGRTMIGSDGIPLPGKPHPRWAGSFTRVLGHYRRDVRLLDLAEAIRKMTALPAQRFSLRDRGVLAPGKAADLVVFDPAEIADRATYEEPLQPPAGVREVLVNGVAVVRGGQLTGAKPGRVLAPT